MHTVRAAAFAVASKEGQGLFKSLESELLRIADGTKPEKQNPIKNQRELAARFAGRK